jgi:hypothetical protein
MLKNTGLGKGPSASGIGWFRVLERARGEAKRATLEEGHSGRYTQ